MSFRENMLWGAASASIQIEGAWDEDGKAPSIWDTMPTEKLKRGETCHMACDHYHRYKEDVALMKEIGLKAYRFSINWPRVIPARGVVNKKGLQFYKDLVEELTAAGIEPIVTLHHAELPVWAFEAGGWNSEDTADAFAEFVRVMVEALSHRVRYWITLNEPQCFSGDYMELAPCSNEKQVSRIILLAHGKAVQVIRKYAKQPSRIGCTVMGITMEPTGEISEEYAAAGTFSDLVGRMGMAYWTDPMILGRIPAPLEGALSDEDMKTICQPLDFFAGNVYFAANYSDIPGQVNPLVYPGMAITENVLYYFAKFAYQRYGLPILVTENGLSQGDFVMLDGKVHDPQRIDYIHRYLLGLKRAAEEGVPVEGYLYWSIMDNYEWFHGYDIRFGLIYVDYRTQQRILKDSARFYREVIETNGETL